MAFIDISQALSPWLRPATDFGAGLLPGFMRDETDRAQLAENTRQFDVAEPLRIAQTAKETESARKLKAANDIYTALMGGQPLPNGGDIQKIFGVSREQALRDYAGFSSPQWHQAFDEATQKYIFTQTPKEGQVAREAPLNKTSVSYWVNGVKQPDLVTDYHNYDAAVAKLKATPGVTFEEPAQNKIDEKVRLYDALRERKMADAEQLIQARVGARADIGRLDPEIKQKYDLLKVSTRMLLDSLYASETDLNALSTKSQAIINGFINQASSLFAQIKSPAGVGPNRNPFAAQTGGGANPLGNIIAPPAAQPTPSPGAAPAGAPPVAPAKPSADQMAQAVRAQNFTDTAEALQYLMDNFGMDQATAVNFLKKYFRKPGMAQ